MTIAAVFAIYFACLRHVWPMFRSGVHHGGLAAISSFVVFFLPVGLILVGWEKLLDRDP